LDRDGDRGGHDGGELRADPGAGHAGAAPGPRAHPRPGRGAGRGDPEATVSTRAAAELAPKLAARADEARELGRLTDEAVGLLAEAGMFRLLAPKERGGGQVSLGTFMGVTEELATGCGSASWVTGIYAAALYMLASFPDAAQDEVYTSARDPKVLAAF